MTQIIQRSNEDQLFSHVEYDLMVSKQLEPKITAAQQIMEGAVGCQLEIDRFEPVKVAGEWILRVFWRKALSVGRPSSSPCENAK